MYFPFLYTQPANGTIKEAPPVAGANATQTTPATITTPNTTFEIKFLNLPIKAPTAAITPRQCLVFQIIPQVSA